MYVSDQLKEELSYYRRMNSHYEVNAGKSTCRVAEAPNEILYMCFAASLVMDYSEDAFFENFYITDKAISGKQEMLIDAYAFIETDQAAVRQLHIFQFKEYESADKAASTVELLNFATFVNNHFVHSELFEETKERNGVIKEITDKCKDFLKRRGSKIEVYCHYINNAKGITKSNEKQINETVMGRFLQDKQMYGFSIQVNGLQDILDLAKYGKIRVGTETLELFIDGANSFLLEDNTSKPGIGLPKRVLVGMCNVNEFIRLQNKYHHNQLYTENVRLYLGDRGAVNKAIIKTITSTESLWFPYMNNGISIICDKLEDIGPVNRVRNVFPVKMNNMQIINGCQTVNALYSAKYGTATKDNFRPANVMVRIYEISPDQSDFKMNIIKATNNQNAVKTYSLMANDPIQIDIANVIKKFGVLYDRKGEAKKKGSSQTVISMTNAAIAYRAVYLRLARQLRSGMGRNRVFKEGEYEKVFDPILREDGKALLKRCCELIISVVILDTIRDLIPQYKEAYLKKLPILMKSAFYISGYLMAMYQRDYTNLCKEMEADYIEAKDAKLQGKDYPQMVRDLVETQFPSVLDSFMKFYRGLKGIDKSDIDNLLKDKVFSEAYEKKLDRLSKKE